MPVKQTRAGTTEDISVSMPAELVSELRSRTGRRGLSSYITEAVGHQLAVDGLAEIVASHEEEYGTLTGPGDGAGDRGRSSEPSYAHAPEHRKADCLADFALGNSAQDVLGPPLITVVVLGWGGAGWAELFRLREADRPDRVRVNSGDDVLRAAEARSLFGIPGTGSAPALRFRDKVVMKQPFHGPPVSAVAYLRCAARPEVRCSADLHAAREELGTVVVRPRDGAGSAGVRVLPDARAVRQSCLDAQACSSPRARASRRSRPVHRRERVRRVS
ncbi:hypothetical protein GCM10010433_12750 [Streptomyces pulveraceus]